MKSSFISFRAPLPYLNLGHTYTHLFMLLYPTAVLALEAEFERSYGALLALATPGFIAFGAGALPAGWLGDRWSRHGMIAIFFLGLGLSSIATGLAGSETQIAIGLTLIGVFASIYHPVGIAMVVGGARKVGRTLGVNGVWGNMGVALAALIAGALTELVSWRAAFIVPGLIALATGAVYLALVPRASADTITGPARVSGAVEVSRQVQIRVFAVLVIATLLGGMVFHATTIGMPKLFEERLGGLAQTTLGIGGLVSVIYAVAAFSQIAVGRLIDRYPLRSVFLIVVGLQVPLLLVAASHGGPALLAGALAIMVFVFGEIPICDTLVARYTTDAWRSRVYAVKYVLSLGVGAATIPLLALTHEFGGGFATLFATLSGLALVITLAVMFLPADRRPVIATVPAGE